MSLRSSILLPVLIAWHGQGTAARSTACTPPDPSENITCAAINITESKRIDPGSGDELRCAGALPCSTCTPPCEKGSIYTGEPLLCGATGKWEAKDNSGCEPFGVHRVGFGVYVMNIANINLQAGSFYIDFMLTVYTETGSFPSYEAALMSFDQDNDKVLTAAELAQRECSPEISFVEYKLGQAPVNAAVPLCSPGVTSSVEGGCVSRTPTQYLQDMNLINMTAGSDKFAGLTFINMDKDALVTAVKTSQSESTVKYRVQGTAYFKPALRQWPFDKQALEVVIEDIEQTLAKDIRFVFCHMSIFSGLSPTIRFPDVDKLLTFDAYAREVCWPPFANPAIGRSSCAAATKSAQLECQATAADTCLTDPDTPFKPFDRSTLLRTAMEKPEVDGKVSSFVSTINGAASCTCKGGEWSSSRHVTRIEYTAPQVQRFIKHFLPVVFITLINMVTYLLNYDEYMARITICIGTLTALVMFHVSMANNLPAASASTFADYVMMCAYALNFFTWFVAITLMLMAQHEWGKYWPKAVQRFTRIYGPLITIAVLAHALNTPDIWSKETAKFIQFWVFLCFIGLTLATVVLRLIEVRLLRWWRQKHPKKQENGGSAGAGRASEGPPEGNRPAIYVNPVPDGGTRTRENNGGVFSIQAMASSDSYAEDDDIPLATGIMLRGGRGGTNSSI